MSISHWPIRAGAKDVSGSNSDPGQNQASWWPFEAGASADWLRGKSTEPLKTAEYRPGAVNSGLGTCLVSKDQLREAHGLRF